ncbi:hypothetical protein [Serratia bockelmannii]|uniref:hypothetical protein n=1 Tax=Serratia bockelmannii TaxID=2703793 RepID=UPI003C2B53A8
MTQTLTTTEELKHLASSDNANELTRRLARECLANREAQPVGFRYRNRDTASWLYNDWRWPDSVEAEQCQIEWLYTALPAPAYPERLPCPVHLLPGLNFGKGVPTRSMLDALVRRAEYESEREAMTPEQKAEDDARIEAFKALLPRPPAPAVPECFLTLLKHAGGMAMGTDWNSGTAAKYHRTKLCEAVEACRAAMLAQPVSSDYKLVPVEATEDMIAAAMNCDDVTFNADETFCVNFGNIYAAMLAAAPGGGNG